VLHHSDTGWTAPTRFEDVIAGKGKVRAALAPYTPHFSFLLVDLSADQANALAEHALTALGRLVLFFLSAAGDDRRLQREIGRMSAALDEVLRAPNWLAAFEALLRYLAATHRRMSGTVPVAVAARIKAAGEAELTRWAVRVLSAPTPEAVVEDVGGAAPRRARRS